MTLVITIGAAAPLSLAAADAAGPDITNTRLRQPNAGPDGSNDARELAKAQVEFGIRVAQKKLWREAAYRFEKAVEVDPTYAAAWNNLAIAYEEQGKFPEADKAYTKAVQLDPGNVLIRQNYDLFKEFYDRINARKRR
ncbi:MAG: tetratricopeptide repeat protein [Vicinamibacterales bacterium]